ncbi:MAG: malto-oligosyltrehalose synthase [Chlamydiales bacterium]
MAVLRIPCSTYRLQFNPYFNFREGSKVIDYLEALGITDLYTSPLMKSTPGSMHSYDVTNPKELNPDIGTEEEFNNLSEIVRSKGMGIIFDIIPNHMCISVPYNQWWNDVLENGPSSFYASFFNIDWNPLRPELKNKVLIPFLDDQFGKVIENQQLKVIYKNGSFFVQYYESIYPTDPKTWVQILDPLLYDLEKSIESSHPDLYEFESIITAINHLPPSTDNDSKSIRERQREKEIIKKRLSVLIDKNALLFSQLEKYLIRLNGTRGAPHTFDHLENFLNQQNYRLSHWRVASDEINYRRFFDINELVGIRTEDPRLFKALHELVLKFIKKGYVTGLRIDHVDGLYDPHQYLRDLQRAIDESLSESNNNSSNGQLFYVVVEKILSGSETLRRHWPVYGTTGYDYLNLLNGIFIDTTQQENILSIYHQFTGNVIDYDELLYESKKFILNATMSSELHVLSRQLDRISEQHRWSKDFTYQSLIGALRSAMAAFSVYRTYICAKEHRIDEEDRLTIEQAIEKAKQHNPTVNVSLFDFIKSVLLLQYPPGLSEKSIESREHFVMRFQQLTGPVMAKGLEDTAFYRYFPLASLNEVGGELNKVGVKIDDFHQFNKQRQQEWAHSFSMTSSHDTKRSEDVRARINVLSELHQEWNEFLMHVKEINFDKKIRISSGALAPDSNEEYLIYQTLIGSFPLHTMSTEEHKEYVSRVVAYMNKALKEAKVHTSWMNPNDEYDRAVHDFIQIILDNSQQNAFIDSFKAFLQHISRPGLLNSLSQVILKITSPGVPDIYQGCEDWNFSLVDPDNRRLVNYLTLNQKLITINERTQENLIGFIKELMSEPENSLLKLFITQKLLLYRKEQRKLFLMGDYVPNFCQGDKAHHIISYSRVLNGAVAVVIAGRFFTNLMDEQHQFYKPESFGSTFIKDLPPGIYRDIFTQATYEITDSIEIKTVLNNLPVSLLELT